MTEEESEWVKRQKKVRGETKGKRKAEEQEAESEEEKVSERLDRMEGMLKKVLAQQKEMLEQQGRLKQRVDMIRHDIDNIHPGMDGLYDAEESSESSELEENNWEAELGKLRAEEIESMQNAGSIETEEVRGGRKIKCITITFAFLFSLNIVRQNNRATIRLNKNRNKAYRRKIGSGLSE
jgi:hypothetical protein